MVPRLIVSALALVPPILYPLCTRSPTALDALVFAYLHCILHSKAQTLRFEVTRRVNLVARERQVQSQVRGRVPHNPCHPSRDPYLVVSNTANKCCYAVASGASHRLVLKTVE